MMGLLSGLMGNASQKNVDKVERDLEDILVPGEQVTLAFSLIRDLIVFTEFRLILVDKQGVTIPSLSLDLSIFSRNFRSF